MVRLSGRHTAEVPVFAVLNTVNNDDFSKVRAAITKQVASGAFFWTTCWAMNLEQQEIKSVVQKGDARCHACDMLGEVTAHFRLHGAVAEPISVEFVADPPVAH